MLTLQNRRRLFGYDTHPVTPNVSSQIQAVGGVPFHTDVCAYLWTVYYPILSDLLTFRAILNGATFPAWEQEADTQDSCHCGCTALFKHAFILSCRCILVSLTHLDTKLERASRAANLSIISFHV